MLDISINESWKQENGKYACPVCGKEYTRKGISTHIWRAHTQNGYDHYLKCGYVAHNTGKEPWNKGLTKETDLRLKQAGETYKAGIISGDITPSWSGKKHSQETIEKMKENGGGYREGSGRGKKGWYNGYWCDSSWELAFVIYNLEHNISFTRNTQKFEYEFEGEKLHYLPDFIMGDGIYVEIKNYNTAKTKAKHAQFPYALKVICGKKEIKPYIDYAISKYGKDFVTLYDNSQYKAKRTQGEYINEMKQRALSNEQINIDKVLSCNIDFSKRGWVQEVSDLIDKHPQKVTSWMKKYLPDFWQRKCFKRSGTKLLSE